ncbi:MAG: glycosyltransferase [Chloroflexi bacterium]|nr:glycosyltransferase [Chloroflexota bacterium]
MPYLVDALLKLDYPVDRLDVLLLLEPDDEEMITVLAKNPLPSHFRTLVVPPGHPKTKARACNVGLAHARGEFLVIYDAEDQPDPDQLKKALVTFMQSKKEAICVQSRLNYYNARQNLLTRLFTLEYSFWFDLLLPGLSIVGAPIPLGGTSNHFRTSAVISLGGWDAFNVAEDCDLGIRLAANGYSTLIMNSTTWEEANSRIGSWVRQRSRWIKGYLQTYLVHMRDPVGLFRRLGFWNFLSFQLTVGGTPFTLLLAPMSWLLMLAHVATSTESLGRDLPDNVSGSMLALGIISLVFSNFVFVYFGTCGALVRNNSDLLKYVMLIPVYYGLQSMAAWKGCLQLLFKPHYWEKTAHGLFPQVSGSPRLEGWKYRCCPRPPSTLGWRDRAKDPTTCAGSSRWWERTGRRAGPGVP